MLCPVNLCAGFGAECSSKPVVTARDCLVDTNAEPLILSLLLTSWILPVDWKTVGYWNVHWRSMRWITTLGFLDVGTRAGETVCMLKWGFREDFFPPVLDLWTWGRMSEEGDVGGQPSTTTISTVAVQAGDSLIVITILKVLGLHTVILVCLK